MKASVAETEDAAVARDEPIPAAGRRDRAADDRSVQALPAERAVKERVAETEDAAVAPATM